MFKMTRGLSKGGTEKFLVERRCRTCMTSDDMSVQKGKIEADADGKII